MIREPGPGGALAGVLLSMLVAGPLMAQDTLRIDDLRVPAAPAFVLLGVAPTTVERPTSPRSLALGLVSGAARENVLPDEYALELAPYWMVPHPTLTYEDYYDPSTLEALVQSLAASVATTPLPDSVGGGTSLGIGARTIPVPGRPHPDLEAHVRTLRTTQDSMNRVRARAEADVDSMLTALEDSVFALGLPDPREGELLDSLSEARAAEHDRAVAFDLAELERAARATALAMQELDKERVGWRLELAGGVVLDYPGDVTADARLRRAGAWVTLARRMPESGLDLIGVARYRHDRAGPRDRNLADVGGRLVWEEDDLSVSGEFLEHLGEEAGDGLPPGYRVALNIEYRVADWGALTATISSDDELDGSGRQRLGTLLGFNLGFGALPLLLGSPTGGPPGGDAPPGG